jgi:hypothetical protein
MPPEDRRERPPIRYSALGQANREDLVNVNIEAQRAGKYAKMIHHDARLDCSRYVLSNVQLKLARVPLRFLRR